MPTDEELKKALSAFRKRLRMQQLEVDSKLGHSPLTGRKEVITAIQPPLGHGKEVWEALSIRGDIKNDGGGFYTLLNKG